ncbi:MAG: hypothetical protein ACRDK1_08170, partial [Solirubrobacterales bacterium]
MIGDDAGRERPDEPDDTPEDGGDAPSGAQPSPEGGGESPNVPPNPRPSTWAGKQGAGDEPEPDAPDSAEPQDADAPEAGPASAEPPDDTVEADTPALADREAAREAALAGLRARTAEHASKQRVAPAPGVP